MNTHFTNSLHTPTQIDPLDVTSAMRTQERGRIVDQLSLFFSVFIGHSSIYSHFIRNLHIPDTRSLLFWLKM